jgi:hypothetical protein
MGSKDPKMSKQGTAGKRKHLTLTIPQKLEGLKVAKAKERYGFIQHMIIDYL